MKNVKGFTLAEVLITLAIIGVVAALTIPSVVKNYQRQQYYTGFMKAYTTLNRTIQMAIADNGSIENWNIVAYTENGDGSDLAFMETFLKPYLKISQTCDGYNAKTGCLKEKPKTLHGSDDFYWNVHKYRQYVLTTGSAIAVYNVSGKTGCKNPTYGCAEIWIDTNGEKGPNKGGRDLFLFMIYSSPDKLVPYGIYQGWDSTNNTWIYSTKAQINSWCNPQSTDYRNGIYCGAKLLLEGKMNY